jgi:hypothetical protein
LHFAERQREEEFAYGSAGAKKGGGMERREFIWKSGVLIGGAALAGTGLLSCGKKEEGAAEATGISRLDKLKKELMEQRGMSEADVAAMMEDLKKKLPMVKEKCICKTCPSYVEGEKEIGFCHPLVGKSEKITKRKGCDCPTCPVYKMLGLKRGYYCIQGSELEMDLAAG